MTHHTPIKRLLIANRGEIAVRIIKTARRLGIHTIALYSDADARAMHVREADEAWHLGPAPARESYLDTGKVLKIAKEANADAIHPGYGFLSENSDFATACEQRGVRFVGPSGAAILAMGDKSGAKGLMQAAGVPVLPGYHGADQHPDFLRDQASQVGFPLLIKAASGGGGKGMRRVDQLADFDDALAAVKREASAAFGDDHVLLERYLPRARHVEVQVFADALGNAIYLGDRDCSLQRRHQKVIEEAPAPDISPALRRAMGEAAVAAAKAIAYRGAGTIEFLLCGEEFFFMEMNTRLQVEHPVTEAITGQDLVAWQLAVAEGKPLPLTQEQVVLRGHAVEARLYAEDVAAGFLPASGPIHWLTWPKGVRIDTGVTAGDEVSPYYDPMIAKLVAHAPSRSEAFATLADALAALDLGPLVHNGPLLQRLCEAPEVLAMRHHTQWPIPTDTLPVPALAWPLATLWLATCERDASRPQAFGWAPPAAFAPRCASARRPALSPSPSGQAAYSGKASRSRLNSGQNRSACARVDIGSAIRCSPSARTPICCTWRAGASASRSMISIISSTMITTRAMSRASWPPCTASWWRCRSRPASRSARGNPCWCWRQ